MMMLRRRGIDRLRQHVTERDYAILRSVRDFKFLSTKHLYELHFAVHASYVSGIRACTRVLTRLETNGFINRLPRPVGGNGGGSTSTIWHLDAVGDRLLRADEPAASGNRSRSYEPTLLFLKHTLAIADLRVSLELLARAGEIEIIEVQTEPSNWRRFVNRAGRPIILKPDLSTITAIADDELLHYWEVDLGSEPISRLIDKSHWYQQYFDTGIEQDKAGAFPQVAWLLPDEKRRQRLQDALSADPALRDELFIILAPDNLSAALSSESQRQNLTGTSLSDVMISANPEAESDESNNSEVDLDPEGAS